MTDSTGATGNIYGTVTTPPKSTNGTSSDDFGSGMSKDTFMQLLVAQLKYQNPLSPTDSDQYMTQMAQFTQVEKLADLQQSQSDLLSWQRTVAGQGMIGKQVTATSESGSGDPLTGTVVGLKLTDAGPRLVLQDGTTVSVDNVTDVAAVSTAASGAGTATPGASTGTGTGTDSGSGKGA